MVWSGGYGNQGTGGFVAGKMLIILLLWWKKIDWKSAPGGQAHYWDWLRYGDDELLLAGCPLPVGLLMLELLPKVLAMRGLLRGGTQATWVTGN